MQDQLELFKPNTLDQRQVFHLLPRYKVAVIQGFGWKSTLDLYLAERGDFKTSLGDIKRSFDTRQNLIAKGYSFLNLIESPTSHYDEWHRKTYPVRTKAKVIEYVYDL